MATSPRGRQVNLGQATALLVAFVVTAGAGGLVAAALMIPVVTVAKGTTDVTVTAFDGLPSELAIKPLPEKSTILAADGTLLAELYTENRIVVPLEAIAPILQETVIAVEDKRFYEHGGVDPMGMLRAVVKNSTTESTQGASTLTQQYVKNVLIEAANSEQDRAAAADAREADGTEGYSRKLREAKLAISLEKETPKEKILEGYLNIAAFGASVYGVEAAAEYYFGKPASDVNYLEAATIAGITKAPGRYDPAKNVDDLTEPQRRRDTVLGLMLQQELISQEEHDAGVATPLANTLNIQRPKEACKMADTVVAGSGYFCDYVTKILMTDIVFGPDRQARKDNLYRGGLTITTTLDPREQALAKAAVEEWLPASSPDGLSTAFSVVQPGTGHITAMAQNWEYVPTGGENRQTALNLNTDYEYGGSRGMQPASTFKPFTLMQWLKEGHSLGESIDGSRRSWPAKEFNAPCTRLTDSGGKAWTPGNAEGGSWTTMSVLDATKNSVNSAYIAMGSKVDLCGMIAGAESVGIHRAVPRADGAVNLTVQPSNIIGTEEVAPLTMSAAYAAFAADGVFCKPIAILSVRAASGEELAVPPADCTPAIEPHIAHAMTYALGNVWNGTASKLGKTAYTSAGKTGTSSFNEHTWFAGYTPLRAAAVWVGYHDGTRQAKNIRVKGKTEKSIYGATIAGPIWRSFMDPAMEGQDVPEFTAPRDKEVVGEKVSVPSVIGQSVDAATATLRGAGFGVSVSPERVSSSLQADVVAEQSPNGSAVRGSVITLRVSDGQGGNGPGWPGSPGLPGGPGAPGGPGNPPPIPGNRG